MSMLGSWFGQKGQDEATLDGNPARPSSSNPVDANTRPSTDKPRRTFPNAFNTPHDAILSLLQTPPSKPGAKDVPNRPGSTRDDQVNSPDFPESVGDAESRADALQNVRSTTPTSIYIPKTARGTPTELLFDPFDGSVLGVLHPKQEDGANLGSTSRSQLNLPGTFDIAAGAPGRASSDAVWTHLSRILDIQSQISKQHLEMENIGTVKAGDAKRKAHKRAARGHGAEFGLTPLATPEVGVEDPLVLPGMRSRKRALSNVSSISSSSEPDGDDEGVDVPSEEAEEKRLREEEFEKLANQFEGRKEAINDIMSKLGELSKALSEFHDLPSPNIEFPAPRKTTTTAGTSTSPNAASPESKYLRPPGESSRTQEWAKQLSTSTLRPIQTSPKRDAKDIVNIASAPRSFEQRKKLLPSVVISPADSAGPSFHDSPASTIGSLKLAPE